MLAAPLSRVLRASFHGRGGRASTAVPHFSLLHGGGCQRACPSLRSRPVCSPHSPASVKSSLWPGLALPPSPTVRVLKMYKSYHGEAKTMFSSNQSCLRTPAIPDVHPGGVFSSPCILHSRAGFYMPVYLPLSISCCCSTIPGTGYFRKKRDLFS